MKSIQIEIPKEIVLSLKMPTDVMQKNLVQEFAIHLYKEGFLSFGKARELASLSKWQFAEKLGEKKIVRHYSEDDLEEDLKYSGGK